MTATESRQECGHVKVWPTRSHAPRLGERVYCSQCQDMRAVLSVPGAWRAQCLSCKWHRERHKLQTLERLITEHFAISTCQRVSLTDYDGARHWTVTKNPPSEKKDECWRNNDTVEKQGNLWENPEQSQSP